MYVFRLIPFAKFIKKVSCFSSQLPTSFCNSFFESLVSWDFISGLFSFTCQERASIAESSALKSIVYGNSGCLWTYFQRASRTFNWLFSEDDPAALASTLSMRLYDCLLFHRESRNQEVLVLYWGSLEIRMLYFSISALDKWETRLDHLGFLLLISSSTCERALSLVTLASLHSETMFEKSLFFEVT